MIKENLVIHLINGIKIEIIEEWFLKDNFLNMLNQTNTYFSINNYIIPKNNISYIEFFA